GFYNIFSSETRILSYLALGLGALNEEEFKTHWKALERPKISDLDFEFEGMDLVLSWAGGAFEFGMPTLFVDEVELGPYSQGINLYKAMVAQRLWAENKGYPVFGESPATDEYYGWASFGAPDTAISPGDAKSRGVIIPHASFLFPFDLAMKNIRAQALLYPEAYLEKYGFASAINTNNNEVIKLYRGFEQGMIVAALANMLEDNFIQKMFLAGLEGEKIKKILKEDKPFFSAFDIAEEITELYNAGLRHLEKGNWRQANTLFEYIDFLDKTYQLNFDYRDWREKYTEAKNLAQENLENLYSLALGEFEQENYSGALKLLKEIVSFDVDYRDAVYLYRITNILASSEVKISR
ncbi:MAG: glucoamylase family protein, partial [Candidatus Omnitrophota bacterium]